MKFSGDAIERARRVKLIIFDVDGGNVTLHPVGAPQLLNDSNVVAASIRNAAHC